MAVQQLILFFVACTMAEGCHKNTDCVSGFCDGGTFFSSGTCRSLVQDGYSCLEGGDSNSCVSRQCTCGKCGRKLPTGYACSTNDNCKSGWCNGGVTIGCNGRCKSRVADGSTCLNSGDSNSCVSRQCTCGKCGRKLPIRYACSTNDNCESGWCNGGVTIGCNGRCKSRVADGGTCLNNGDSNSCKSLQCTCGKCGKKLPNGYSCSTNDNCESGWCNGKVTIGCGGKCKRRHDDYEACPLNILGSGDNNICKSGRCEKVSGTTALCAPKVGFRAGTKCNEDTDCDKTKSLWCSGGSFYSSGKCTKCPDKCPDGCNALFNQNLKCGRMTTFDHAADLAKKIAKPIFDFVKCLAPEDIGCIADAGKGIIECLDTSTPCKIKIGGKGSTCLALNSAKQTFNYGTGMFIMDGDVEPTGGMSVEADITNGKINIELHGKVAVKVNAKFETTQSVNMPITKKKLYLTSCSGKRCTPCKTPQNANICRPLTLYTKVFMIGYIPVIVQVKVQIVAELFMKLKTTGSFKASISYENNAVVRIKKALVTFDPIKGVKFDVGFEDNFSTDIKKTLVVNAGVDLLAVARIGPEISVVVNGIPMKMMLAARFVMEGNLLLSQPACMTGSFSAGIGLDAGISADLSLPNPGELAGMACQSLVGAACKVPLVKVANCAVKVFTKVDPCKKAQGMCSDMAKEIAKLTPSNLGKGFTGTAIIINAKFVPFNLTGKTYCVSGQTKFYSKAGKYGSGTLSGGGGGNGIKTCGAPGVSKCGKSGAGVKMSLRSFANVLGMFWLYCFLSKLHFI